MKKKQNSAGRTTRTSCSSQVTSFSMTNGPLVTTWLPKNRICPERSCWAKKGTQFMTFQTRERLLKSSTSSRPGCSSLSTSSRRLISRCLVWLRNGRRSRAILHSGWRRRMQSWPISLQACRVESSTKVILTVCSCTDLKVRSARIWDDAWWLMTNTSSWYRLPTISISWR